MGASRKLQGEIDRVLKKVQEGVDVFDSIWNKVYDTENANQKEKFEADLKKEIKKLQRYRDQIKTWIQSSEIKDKKALMDARKLIEREMERFKVCEKETKTKAFSKEGLGQQPKTDPKEKAKSETRDWLNNVVGDLESQIDNFEAEIEGLSVKKGKTKPPRWIHLDKSIARHKVHIMKLELILRLLDNDELSPDQVNDVKDFLEDYVERNQENFDEFDDVDELYSTLSLDNVDVEDTLGPSSLVKGTVSVSTASAVSGLKNSVAISPTQLPPASPSITQQSATQDQSEETTDQDSNSDVRPRTPPSKSGAMGSLVSAPSPSISSGPPAGSDSVGTANITVRSSVGGPMAAAILSGPVTVHAVTENSAAAVSSLLLNSSSTVNEDDSISFPSRRLSPAIPEIGLGRGIGIGISNQAPISAPMSLGLVSGISSHGSLDSVPAASDMAKRNILSTDERSGSVLAQPLVSPLSNRMLLQQVSKNNDGTGSNDPGNVSEGAAGSGRVFLPSLPGVQLRPQSITSFQNQNEMGQFRGRPEITPDQREKFLQRFQQVQQQGHNPLLSMPNLPGANHKQFSAQQQNSLLQQFNSQSSSLPSQTGLGLNVPAPGLTSVTSATQQLQTPIHQQISQHPLIPTGPKDADVGNSKMQEQQRLNFSDDLNGEPTSSTTISKVKNDDDLKTPYTVRGSASFSESNQLPTDIDLSSGQPLQHSQPSISLGVIGRSSIPDLGAIGDNISGSFGYSGGMHDQMYNLQMLESAYHKLPQPKDSERVKSYIPRHPAATPASFPQTQASFFSNPAFWEQLGRIPSYTEILFFTFYYQQNTCQQYLAAKALKKNSWRYHKKYNTWFQRHVEPKVTNDEFEWGTYLYFDFHIADDGSQHGWCQRIMTDFTFEYSYLEDELVS